MTTVREIEDAMYEHSDVWGKLYNRSEWIWVPDGESYTVNHDSVDILGLGTINVVDRYDDYDDGHALYVVFNVDGGDETFRMQGWYDSWGGDGGWEGPLVNVVGEQVVKTEWKVVK